MNFELKKGYQSDEVLRASFNELAEETFCLDFENWYRSGYWGRKYIPYSIVSDGRVVSNISVNHIDCLLDGKERHYIQLGTVMTKKAFRHRGFSRRLMETILADYASCDGFFLYANDSVLDFYPKFGFRRRKEYRFRLALPNGGAGGAVNVPMQTPSDWQRFLAEKNKRRECGVLQMQTDDLLMFYLTQFMRDNVFYIPADDAYAVARVCEDTLILYGVYSSGTVGMKRICEAFGPQIRSVSFAFPPEESAEFSRAEWKEGGTTFFVQGTRLERDMETIGSFPELVHA